MGMSLTSFYSYRQVLSRSVAVSHRTLLVMPPSTPSLPVGGAQPFYGYVDTTGDALRLIEVSRSLLPILQWNLTDSVSWDYASADHHCLKRFLPSLLHISHRLVIHLKAARRGILPRITRRLNELERRSMIRSGAIFIFSVEESGIKRWTEGLSWSQSRIAGNFLVCLRVKGHRLASLWQLTSCHVGLSGSH